MKTKIIILALLATTSFAVPSAMAEKSLRLDTFTPKSDITDVISDISTDKQQADDQGVRTRTPVDDVTWIEDYYPISDRCDRLSGHVQSLGGDMCWVEYIPGKTKSGSKKGICICEW